MSQAPKRPSDRPPTADELWTLLESKVDERIEAKIETKTKEFTRLIWFGGAIITAIIPAIAGAFMGILAVPGVKDSFVRNVILDPQAEIKKYLVTHVAYSYSSVFGLSASRKSYTLHVHKEDGDQGIVECEATYPNTIVHNPIYLTLNNQAKPVGQITPKTDSNLGRLEVTLQKKNGDNFAPFTRASDHQDVIISLDDTDGIEGTVWLACTVTIIGPAKLPEQG